MDFISRIDTESDNLVMSTVKSEYGFILQFGGLFVNLRPKWRMISIMQFITYSGMIISHLFFFMKTLSINYNNMDMNSALSTLHYGSLVSIALIILFLFPLNRSTFVNLMKIIGNNYYTYSDGFQSKLVDKWNKDIRKMKIIVLILIPCYFLLCAIGVIFISPMIDSYIGLKVNNETYVNGIYMKLPINVWYPFKIDNSFSHMLVLCYQVFSALIVATISACADLLILFISQGMVLQFKILRISIQNIEERAMKLYNNKFGELNKAEMNRNETYMKMINLCIKENVQHHIVLLRAFQYWFQLQKWPMIYVIMAGSLIIALSLLGFVMGEATIAGQFVSLLLLVAEVATMALFCFVGQQITDMSEGMIEDFYNLKWMRWNKSCKLSLQIVKEFLKNPLELKAGGLNTLNHETFANILNGAYTYFNLIFAYKGS